MNNEMLLALVTVYLLAVLQLAAIMATGAAALFIGYKLIAWSLGR